MSSATDSLSAEENLTATPPLPPPPPGSTPLPPQSTVDLSSAIKSKAIEEATPWINYAVQQALIYQKTAEETLDDASKAFKSRFSEFRTIGSAHFNQTLASFQDVKFEFDAYEELMLGKVKEGIDVATSHPFITGGAAVALGLLVLKRPRRFLYYNTLRLFHSEEALLARADAKVKELRKSISQLKAESENLERRATMAEAELIRGRTKLKQTGKQICGVIRSAYKIERQASGLKDVLRELPGRAASQFRTQVTNLASETKKERTALTKEVTKISNYGISV